LIEGQENLKSYITNFYKKLFGKPSPNSIHLDTNGVDSIFKEDKIFLTKTFTMEEIKVAVFGMAPNKADGPDGFNAEFFQVLPPSQNVRRLRIT
jgi:hypothetical protein